MPNTTQVPDIVFDELMPRLGDAELRVLFYIIRRTFGFKKRSDDISLKQMVEGITTKEGRVLDRGTGLAKSAVARAVKSLVGKGIVTARRNATAERGNEPTSYALRFKSSAEPAAPLSSKKTPPCPPGGLPLVLLEDPQHTVLQQAEQQGHHHHGDSMPMRARSMPEQGSDDDDELASRLHERGVSAAAAWQLVTQHPPTVIRTQIAYFDFRRTNNSRQIGTNPAGFLRRAIEQNYPPPQGYVAPEVQAAARRRADEQAGREAAQRARLEQERVAAEAADHAILPEQRARQRVENLRRLATITGRSFSDDEVKARFAELVTHFRRSAEAFFASHPEVAHLRRQFVSEASATSEQSTIGTAIERGPVAASEGRRRPHKGRGVSAHRQRPNYTPSSPTSGLAPILASPSANTSSPSPPT